AGQGPAAGVEGRDERQRPVQIGVFRDAAFQFYYPENLEALRRLGASLVEISPLADSRLPQVDALYVGGGFPETLAPRLAANHPFRASLREAILAGLPVYAECGGAVFLGKKLLFEGQSYPMAGALPASFAFQSRPQGHGYVVLEAVRPNPFYAEGETLRGHEFHYTYVESAPALLEFAFRVRRGHGFDGRHDGLCHHNVLAVYTHVHALGTPAWAPGLVRAASRFRAGRAAPAVLPPATSR
ncbi:MAG TPA: cobyrinic acid a,c-diamide synthase, partial [Planctomycetaceae bacterium]|nr:cobyrinic acid a,c-diamide synthase [Planctomycetaceae bacterium]